MSKKITIAEKIAILSVFNDTLNGYKNMVNWYAPIKEDGTRDIPPQDDDYNYNNYIAYSTAIELLEDIANNI